jgi:hypothetical protein
MQLAVRADQLPCTLAYGSVLIPGSLLSCKGIFLVGLLGFGEFSAWAGAAHENQILDKPGYA